MKELSGGRKETPDPFFARRLVCQLATAFAIVASAGGPILAQDSPDNPLGKTPTLKAPAWEDVRRQALDWLDAQKPSHAARAGVEQLWPETADDDATVELLDRLAKTFALGDPRAAELVALCSRPRQPLAMPAQDWLTDQKTDSWVRHHMRLYYGRWLSQERLYDESLAVLQDLKPEDVVDPAALLFYQSVAHHRLVNKEEGLKAITRLAEDVAGSPRRYVALAALMKTDLEGLADDSLDHVSRRMDDIYRRLDLGRAGQKVRQIEDGVVQSLDKLIEEMEKQQQQQSGAGSGGAQSTRPAPDSMPLGGRGAGEADKKDPNSAPNNWGTLPPKRREEALQQIGKDFPPHYREIIEQYFRRMATDDNQPQK
jgi:hypothetical protein